MEYNYNTQAHISIVDYVTPATFSATATVPKLPTHSAQPVHPAGPHQAVQHYQLWPEECQEDNQRAAHRAE